MRKLTKAATMAAAACGLLLGLSGTAVAAPDATCASFGCDGHNPNAQTWQSPGAWTEYTIPADCDSYIDLRYGVTDGDPYAWARVEWNTGCGDPAVVWVDRYSKASGVIETSLGKHTLLTAGDWSAQEGAYSWNTWSGMYYDSSLFEVRACVNFSNPYGGLTCTSWY